MKINTTASKDTRFLRIDPEDLHSDKCSGATLDGHISLLMDCEKLVELRDLLNKTFPETTKNEIAEPTDLGLYITADGQQILLLDEDGDWRAVDDNFQPIRGFWGDSTFESDWTTVCEKLGDAATTLTKVTASDINVTPVRVIQ